MKASAIKVGHVYYVDFDPVRQGEFDRRHLAVVLKRNKNNVTFITIPLTGNSDGDSKNKIKLNITNLLPPHLRSKDTYAVYDQVRTVNASRFQVLVEGGKVYDTVVPEKELLQIYEKIIGNLLDGLDSDVKETIKKSLFTKG